MADGFKALGPREGEALWSGGSLMIVKASAEDTHGGMTVIEQECPPGLDSPAHVHESEEQSLFMLAGAIEWPCGDDVTRSLRTGDFVVLPRGVPHSFVVGPEGARFLSLTTPGGFERFARAIGARAETLSPPSSSEVGESAAVAAWSTYNRDTDPSV